MRRSNRTSATVRAGRVPVLLLAAAAALVLSTPPATAGDKPLDLVLNVPPNKVLHYKLDQQTDATYQGVSFTSVVAGEMTLTRAENAKSDNLVFTLVIDKMEASARQGSELMPQELGLAGKKMQIEVTTRGKVVQTEPQGEVSDQQLHMMENVADALFYDLPVDFRTFRQRILACSQARLPSTQRVRGPRS